MADPIFKSNIFEQKRSLEELISESKASGDFYFLLFLSSVITTLGLLIDDTAIVIGGMLVAPLLYPLLFLAMAITTTSKAGVLRALSTLVKSVGVVVVVSVITAFLFHDGVVTTELLKRTSPNLVSIIIAFFAGMAGAFGWAKHKFAALVAGIAVSVALVPPLATFGVGITLLDKTVISGSLTLFIVNLIGVVLASGVVFVLFGFGRFQREEEQIIKEEKIEEEIQERAKEEAENIDEARKSGIVAIPRDVINKNNNGSQNK